MRETVLQIPNHPALIGILAEGPKEGRRRTPAWLFLNDGLVHRVGPQHLHVRMARDLAGMGFSTLRFDLAGIGDSPAADDECSVEQRCLEDLRRVMDHLQRTRGTREFVLVGMCAGGIAAARVATEESRVTGVVLLNPQLQMFDDNPQTADYVNRRSLVRYYLRVALFRPGSWWNALRGKSDVAQILRTVAYLVGRKVGRLLRRNQHPSSGVGRVARGLIALRQRCIPLHVIFNEGNPGYDYLRELGRRPGLHECRFRDDEIVQIPDSDHGFLPVRAQEEVSRAVCQWATRFQSAPGVPARAWTRVTTDS